MKCLASLGADGIRVPLPSGKEDEADADGRVCVKVKVLTFAVDGAAIPPATGSNSALHQLDMPFSTVPREVARVMADTDLFFYIPMDRTWAKVEAWTKEEDAETLKEKRNVCSDPMLIRDLSDLFMVVHGSLHACGRGLAVTMQYLIIPVMEMLGLLPKWNKHLDFCKMGNRTGGRIRFSLEHMSIKVTTK